MPIFRTRPAKLWASQFELANADLIFRLRQKIALWKLKHCQVFWERRIFKPRSYGDFVFLGSMVVMFMNILGIVSNLTLFN